MNSTTIVLILVLNLHSIYAVKDSHRLNIITVETSTLETSTIKSSSGYGIVQIYPKENNDSVLAELFKDRVDRDTKDVPVSSNDKFTVNEDDEGNETSLEPVQSVTIGSWTIIECVNNAYWWICEMERHLVIPELGVSDTLKFVVGSEKLKVGCLSNDRPPLQPEQSNIRLNVMFKCPETHYPSLWLGVVIGLASGIFVFTLFIVGVVAL